MRVQRDDCGRCGDGITIHLTTVEAAVIERRLMEDDKTSARLCKRLREVLAKPVSLE